MEKTTKKRSYDTSPPIDLESSEMGECSGFHGGKAWLERKSLADSALLCPYGRLGRSGSEEPEGPFRTYRSRRGKTRTADDTEKMWARMKLYALCSFLLDIVARTLRAIISNHHSYLST